MTYVEDGPLAGPPVGDPAAAVDPAVRPFADGGDRSIRIADTVTAITTSATTHHSHTRWGRRWAEVKPLRVETVRDPGVEPPFWVSGGDVGVVSTDPEAAGKGVAG
jgi:hypothetical protein